MGQEEPAASAEEGWDGDCGFCGEARAVVYCRADAAGLCLRCDRHVHSANTVSSRHSRSLLCDACRAAPAAILCPSCCLLVCPNCDFDAHQGKGGAAARHDRRPLEPFSGCPTAAELLSLFGLGADEKSVMGSGDADWLGGDGFAWAWEMPQFVSLDDLIVPTTHCHGFQAAGIPLLPKKRNSVCGKHKEEILRQLRELMKSEADMSHDCGEQEKFTVFHSLVPQENTRVENFFSDCSHDVGCIDTPAYELDMLQWNQIDPHEATDPLAYPCEKLIGNSSAMNATFVDAATDNHATESHASDGRQIPGHSLTKEHNWLLQLKGGHELVCPDRDSVISRYKEKRKTRRYDKLIRYESRKARADNRVRIKGRFAKASEVVKS